MAALEAMAQKKGEADHQNNNEKSGKGGSEDETAMPRKDSKKLIGRPFGKDHVDSLPIVALVEALASSAEIEVVSNGKVAQLGYSMQESNIIPWNLSKIDKYLAAGISPVNAFQEDTKVIEGVDGITGTKTLIGQLSLSEEFI